MLIKSIRFEPELEDIEKRDGDNVDAIIELNDGYEYIVPVITHKNILSLKIMKEVIFYSQWTR